MTNGTLSSKFDETLDALSDMWGLDRAAMADLLTDMEALVNKRLHDHGTCRLQHAATALIGLVLHRERVAFSRESAVEVLQAVLVNSVALAESQ